MKRQMTADQALSRLQALCSASEQCSFDLVQKLRRWKLPADIADKIIRLLEEQRFIDDERFARAYTRHAYRFSKWGKAKISAALAAKHIPREIISEAIEEEIDSEEYHSIAKSILTAKARSLCIPSSYENRVRLYRFMASRGFETHLISRLLTDVLNEISTDDDQSVD